MRLIKAPFTEEQLSKLWEYQLNPKVHPYACECGMTMYPIERGLICVCGKIQDWFYDYGKDTAISPFTKDE